ncbi:MAG: hypothetical protein AB8D78_06925 [Akkermansiaceae bacterium]
MKVIFSPLFFLVGLMPIQSVFSQDVAAETSIDQLVVELASETFRDREDASNRLWELGPKALPALRSASQSDDPERAFRAAEILEKVELRISPDTPEKVLALIERYRKAPLTSKSDLLSELKGQRAYFQLLKLYSAEEPNVRKSLASSVRGVAMMGARDAIAGDDVEAAIELLRISSGGYSELMGLACIYRNIGQLDEELENLNPPENVPTDFWKLTLLRAKGDLEGAMQYAAETKQVRLLAALKVLSGDPTLWLQQNGMGDRRRQAPDAYVDVALKRWKGEVLEKDDFAPLAKLLNSRNENERGTSMSALASLGRLDLVEVEQQKRSPNDAFAYYLSRENVPKALSSIGLDPEEPNYRTWVEKRIARLVDADEEGQNEALREIVILAGFMERRGLHKEIVAALSVPFADYAKEDEGGFLELVGMLFAPPFGAPRFATTLISDWAGDDEGRWNEVFAVALGNDDKMQVWLNWIHDIEPGLSEREVLDVMLAIFKINTSSEDVRKEWLEKAWRIAEQAENEELKLVYIDRILELAVEQEDVVTALRAWDILKEDQQAARTWESIDRFFSAAGRWEETAEILSQNGRIEVSSSPELHAHLAVSYRNAGQEERAREHDILAEKLALGDAMVCARIAGYYSYAGDYERALKWQQRAGIQASISRGEFIAVLDGYATLHMQLHKFEIAASCHEAMVQLYASQRFTNGALSAYAKARLNADLARAMDILPEDRERAVRVLRGIHQNFLSDGILADDFFPLLRKYGLVSELEEWFGESWAFMRDIIETYPDSHNSRNTAAWFASRAVINVKAAQDYLEVALKLAPEQPAYLDTMAELQFAQGNRKKAVEFSNRAVQFSPSDDMIRLQNYRFRHDPLPN